MKIRTRFNLLIMIFVIIVFAIMYFASVRISRNRIIEDIGNHIATAIKFKARSIDELLKTYIEFTELVSTGFPFVKYFSAGFDKEINEGRIKTRINSIINKRGSVSRIRILDINGIVVISSHDDVGIDRADRKIFLEGKKRTYVSDIHFSEFTGKYVISIAVPILTNGKTSGVLVINYVAKEQLFPIIKDITGMTHSTEFYLLDKDHFLLTPTKYNDKIWNSN